MTAPTLRFLGAAGTVTGSRHLLAHGGRTVLLDCGLFQGLKPLRLRNRDPFPFEPARLDAVVLSHAHLDHSGALPLLVRQGFRGPIHCTAGTAALLEVLLPDAAYLQEEEAAYANRKGFSTHRPALPLFTDADAVAALRQVVPHPFATPFDACPGVTVRFGRAGHILGSATTCCTLAGGPRVLYTGDLGRPGQPILVDPDPPPAADVLLVESTYGDRVHPTGAREALARVVREAAARGGALLVPAFAVGRTQALLWLLAELEDAGAIPRLPLFLDSPMAERVSALTCRHGGDLDAEMRRAMAQDRCPLCTRRYTYCATPEASKALNARTGPFIVLAGSGMATGGRILHHLHARLPDPRTTVLLVGFQAAGTRGRTLQDGAEAVKMHGTLVPVRARVEWLDGLSAHADREETLRWLGTMPRPPRRTWVVHGEPPAAAALADAIRTRLRWRVEVALDGATVPCPT